MKNIYMIFAILMMAVTASAKDIVFSSADTWTGTVARSCTKDGITFKINCPAATINIHEEGYFTFDEAMPGSQVSLSVTKGATAKNEIITGVTVNAYGEGSDVNLPIESISKGAAITSGGGLDFQGEPTITPKSFTVHLLDATHEHNYEVDWTNDETNHWHACTGSGVCDAPKTDEAAHSYGSVVTETAYYTCSVCQYVNQIRYTDYEAAMIAASVAKIGSDYYATLQEAVDAATTGQTISVIKNFNLTNQVDIAGKEITLDLCGKNIGYSGTTDINSGLFLVHNGAGLTIDNSIVGSGEINSVGESNFCYAAIALTKAGDDPSSPAKLTINDGDIKGYYYAITGNGSRPNTEITLTSCGIYGMCPGGNIGIYHPQDGKLTVNAGTWIEAYDAAIEMRAGTLIINKGTFKALATEYSCNPNGSGSTTSGAAIAIAQHTTKKDISVTINDGNFYGVKTISESNPQANDPAPQVALRVNDGSFYGEITTADVDHFIYGGYYDHAVPADQCASCYIPVLVNAETGYYTVEPGPYVATIGSERYATVQDAINAANTGDVIEMHESVEVTSQIDVPAGKDITLALEGKTIAYTGADFLSSGVIMVHNGAKLTVSDSFNNSGTIDGGGNGMVGVAVTKAGDDPSSPAVLVVNSGTIIGLNYGISGNGTRHNTDITINGGVVKASSPADGTGIYQPQVGTLTINGGLISGHSTGVEVRAGSINVTGGTLESTASTFSCSPNGNGTTTIGAALAIEQHTTKKNIEVEITGGTFKGVMAVNESNPQANDPAPQVTMSISGGEFQGGVTTTDVDKFISGGTFSSEVLPEQCAEGYAPADLGNGKYGVEEYNTEFNDGEETWTAGATVNYKRTFNGNWQALYVPFAIPADKLEGFTVAQPVSCDGTKMIIEPVTSTEAHGIYFIKAETAGEKTIQGVTLEAAPADPTQKTVGDYVFVGVYENQVYAMWQIVEGWYYSMTTAGALGLYENSSATDETVVLKAQRWFMFNPSTMTARPSLSLQFATDGIEDVNVETVKTGKFIENGRIVIRKAGKAYTVAGQEL